MPDCAVRISVIIPLYNGADHIKKCIEQLDNQDCDFPFDVYVVDDASTDNSAEIVESQMRELVHAEYFHLI
ncbi:MAG: glycosyltransferase, partial [Paludibacteraceae bacterium]|nr:glycosyltransferase [Paludibacteraceae bacterium]